MSWKYHGITAGIFAFIAVHIALVCYWPVVGFGLILMWCAAIVYGMMYVTIADAFENPSSY